MDSGKQGGPRRGPIYANMSRAGVAGELLFELKETAFHLSAHKLNTGGVQDV